MDEKNCGGREEVRVRFRSWSVEEKSTRCCPDLKSVFWSFCILLESQEQKKIIIFNWFGISFRDSVISVGRHTESGLITYLMTHSGSDGNKFEFFVLSCDNETVRRHPSFHWKILNTLKQINTPNLTNGPPPTTEPKRIERAWGGVRGSMEQRSRRCGGGGSGTSRGWPGRPGARSLSSIPRDLINDSNLFYFVLMKCMWFVCVVFWDRRRHGRSEATAGFVI